MVDPATDRETSSYDVWLKRANLTHDQVFALKSADLARVGRQWQNYQVTVKRLLSETNATRPEDVYFPWIETRTPRL